MTKRLAVVLVLIGSLVFAAGASASSRDSNRDRIPDRWEKQHGLSLKVKQTKRDQDRDGYKNYAEWRAKTDPHDADSDDDGMDDDDEQAGTVKSYTGGVLTITLFDGGELSGKVTDETEIECEVEDESVAKTSGDPSDEDGHADEDHGDEDHGDEDHGDEDHGDEDHGDEDHGDGDRGHHDDEGEECPAGALAKDAIVEEAELKITSSGRVWEEIELR